MTTTRTPPRIPLAAARMRLPLWQRGQQRMRERYGFDLNDPDALDRARGMLAAKPEDADMHLLVASVLATQGNNTEAEAEVRRALELNSESARAHTTLATLLVQRGEGEEGLQEARWAAELDEKDPTVLYNVGLAEWTAGSRGAAKKAFRAAADALSGPREAPWWRRVFRATAPDSRASEQERLTPSGNNASGDGTPSGSNASGDGTPTEDVGRKAGPPHE